MDEVKDGENDIKKLVIKLHGKKQKTIKEKDCIALLTIPEMPSNMLTGLIIS